MTIKEVYNTLLREYQNSNLTQRSLRKYLSDVDAYYPTPYSESVPTNYLSSDDLYARLGPDQLQSSLLLMSIDTLSGGFYGPELFKYIKDMNNYNMKVHYPLLSQNLSNLQSEVMEIELTPHRPSPELQALNITSISHHQTFNLSDNSYSTLQKLLDFGCIKNFMFQESALLYAISNHQSIYQRPNQSPIQLIYKIQPASAQPLPPNFLTRPNEGPTWKSKLLNYSIPHQTLMSALS